MRLDSINELNMYFYLFIYKSVLKPNWPIFLVTKLLLLFILYNIDLSNKPENRLCQCLSEKSIQVDENDVLYNIMGGCSFAISPSSLLKELIKISSFCLF